MSATTNETANLTIRTMGPFRLERAGNPVDLHLCGLTLEGLAYLFFHADQPVRKEKIASMLWPDRSEKSSRGLLSTALWRMRTSLKDVNDGEIVTEAGCVMLSVVPQPFIDAIELDRRVTAALAATKTASSFRLPKDEHEALRGAISDEDGEFLEGMTAGWILVERERVFNLQVRALILLMNDLSERGRFEDALDLGRRILHLDPFRECVHRQVMWLYVLAGQRGNAICQFNRCERVLKKELGIDPMIETVMLKDHILGTENSPYEALATTSLPRHGKDAARSENIIYRISEVSAQRQSLLCMLNSNSLV